MKKEYIISFILLLPFALVLAIGMGEIMESIFGRKCEMAAQAATG